MAAANANQVLNYMQAQTEAHGRRALSFPEPSIASALGVPQTFLSGILEDLMERGKIHRTGISKDQATGQQFSNYALGRGW